MSTKRITRAGFKSFLNKNVGKLFLKVESDFNGMTDCVEHIEDSFSKIEKDENVNRLDHTLGYGGLWLVGNSRDWFTEYEDSLYKGISWYNCCGSGTIAIKK